MQGAWIAGYDATNHTLFESTNVSNMQPWGHGKCMLVNINWSQDPSSNWAGVRKTYDPPLDLSDRTHFNFYVQLDNLAEVVGFKVELTKTDDSVSDVLVYTNNGTGFYDDVWRLVSLPKASFSDPDWNSVKWITILFHERPPYDQSGITFVWLDEIGCDFTGPDVVRNNSDSGYYKTGHKMLCSRCHDQSSNHIDNNRLPFMSFFTTINNPIDFRFYDDPDMQMELPFTTGEYDAAKYALCYQCHEESWLREEANPYPNADLKTNFRDDRMGQFGGDHNLHVYHLPGWAGTCVICHDPHGQWNPAMNREEAGDLVYKYSNGDTTIENRTIDLVEPQKEVPDWYDPDANFWGEMSGDFDNLLCTSCHFGAGGSYPKYYRTYKRIPHGGPCADCHDPHVLEQSHTTHTQANPKGPDPLDCSDCHGLDLDPNKCEDCHSEGHPAISTMENMITVGTCDNCHSPGGENGFDGVQMGRANWELGPYDGGGLLKSGCEEWCASCHDDDPASSNQDGSGELAPTITGDNDTYGYYITGHGLDAEAEYALMCYQEGSGNGNPGADVICDQCHDSDSDHIVSGADVTRLKAGFENDDQNSNCNQCHPPGTDATAPPDLYTNSAEYEGAGHGGLMCTECHDVHGMFGAYTAMTAGDCRDCLYCHNGEGLEPHPAAPVLPTMVPEHDIGSLDSCSSGCHNPHIPAHAGGEPNCFSAGCHAVSQMHTRHFASDPGPGLPLDENGCNECHAGGDQQCQLSAWFWDNKPFEETLVCGVACHIPRDLGP
jgi:hypothetical protein